MKTYFDYEWNGELVDRGAWFHNMPLKNGKRINGACHDKNREQKLWEVFRREGIDFKDKSVLDIGANDGYFSVAAKLAGAKHVTSVNPEDIAINIFPKNLVVASKEWDVETEIIVDTFMNIHERKYDIILFFGVLYHSEDVLGAFRKMKSLLTPGGTILIETPLTRVKVDKPILEVASDTKGTTIDQGKQWINRAIGLGSFFIPNFAAMEELTWMVDMEIEQLPDNNLYTSAMHDRKLFILRDKV